MCVHHAADREEGEQTRECWQREFLNTILQEARDDDDDEQEGPQERRGKREQRTENRKEKIGKEEQNKRIRSPLDSLLELSYFSSSSSPSRQAHAFHCKTGLVSRMKRQLQ